MRSLRGYNGKKPENERLKNMGFDEDTLKKYAGKSEDELIGELLSSVREQKNNGTFEPERLKTLIAAVSPSLTGEQRKRLNDLMQLIGDGV